MGRRRKAWLPNRSGKRHDSRSGKALPGYYVLWNDYGPDGKRHHHSKHFLKQTHAREYCRRLNAKRDLDALDQTVVIPISEACREFLCGLTARSRGTKKIYRIVITQFMEATDNMATCEVGRHEIDSFIASRMATVSEATVAKDCRALRRFFRWCTKNNYATMDPTTMATSLPRTNIVRKKPRISSEQFAALIAALDTEDRRLAVQIAATTGLDRNVIRQLTPADVDLENRQFSTTRFKVKRHVYPFIHDDLVSAIAQRIDRVPATHSLFQGLHHQGRPTDWWKRAVLAAGMPNLKFVDLRTYAVNWLRAILGDFDAQHIVGHSTPMVTARHYYQANPQSQRLISEQPLPGSPARRDTEKTE